MTPLQEAKKQKYEYAKRVEEWMLEQPLSYWENNPMEYERNLNMINLMIREHQVFNYDL